MKRQKITREMRCRAANEVALFLKSTIDRGEGDRMDAESDGDAYHEAQLRADMALWRKLFRVADRDADSYCARVEGA